ncbi:hypothetical protein GCM10011348_00890 [Marinobacterium nitratireducens]|uniref:Uncharacterized protein n=1 Tax=Marinobacterium nitratireducens TaxID=518897 RepID=A0A917Z6T9_9GAMM|nr:hypothetical protein [Marinobacterium nitratireducens]GGO75634.1 hypothetical protein GCM10011348_00890 [Marinobacterium nitratireducens]
MSKSIKVVVKRKGEDGATEDPALAAKTEEALQFVRGLRKKGDNLKVMVDKLNEHDHLQPGGEPWDYASLNDFIHRHGL